MEQNNQETEIDLKEILFVLLDRIWIIILSGIAVGLAALLFSKVFMTPMYTSVAGMYVMNKDSDSITSSDIQVSSQLTNDYVTLVTSRTVLEKVIENLHLDMSVSELKSNISVTTPTNTRIINISVQDEDAFVAKKIVDAVAEFSSERIIDIMNIDQVNIYEYGNVPTRQSSPNVFKNTIIGILLGIVLSVAIIVVKFIVDDTIKTEDDIEKYLGCPMLAAIPYSKALDDGSKRKKNKKFLSKKNMNRK